MEKEYIPYENTVKARFDALMKAKTNPDGSISVPEVKANPNYPIEGLVKCVEGAGIK